MKNRTRHIAVTGRNTEGNGSVVKAKEENEKNSLPSKFSSSNLFNNLTVQDLGRLVGLGPLKGVHNPVSQEPRVLGHHTVGDVVEVEEVVHEVVDDTKALRRTVVIAVRRELTGLEAVHSRDLFGSKVGNVGEHPLKRLCSFLVTIGVVGEREIAVRDKVGKDERGRRRESRRGRGVPGARWRVKCRRDERW